MQQQIIVPVKRRNQIKHVIPYLEEITEPGMKIVFLVWSSGCVWPWMNGHLTAMHSGNLAALQNWEVVWRYDVERQQRLAEEAIGRFAEGLKRRGVEIEVQIYSGALRTILEHSTRAGNVRLVVIPVRDACGLIRLGRLLWNAFTLMNRPAFSRVVLLHPKQIAER